MKKMCLQTTTMTIQTDESGSTEIPLDIVEKATQDTGI